MKWNLANRFLSQILSLVIGIILARLLSPEEFGIVGMVAVFTGFAGIFVDFGFTSAIIQNKDSDSRHWSSIFWLNLIMSIIIAVVFTFMSPLIANFFDQPLLLYVSIAISWTFLIQSFGLVQGSLMKKDLRFKELASIEVVAQIVAGIVAIAAAYNGWSYWSLILQQYISSIMRGILIWSRTNWRPRAIIDWSAIKEMMGFSLPLIGMQTTHYWTHNIDSLIVGKVLGDTALGIYGRAYTLMLVPLQAISRVVSSVMFPAFALIQDDPERIRRTYISINRVIALITFPMMLGLIVTAEPFVRLLLGEQWMGVVPIIQILAPIGAWRSVHSLSGNIFMARGATKLLFNITLPSSFLVAAAMLIGVYTNGLIGLSIGYCFGSLVIGLALDFYLNRLIGLAMATNLQSLLPIALAAILMAGTVYFSDMLYLNICTDILRMILLVSIGVTSYAFFLWVLGLKQAVFLAIKQVKN